MKSTSTSNAAKGRKSSTGSASKNQHRTGGRQASSGSSRQGGTSSRQGSNSGSRQAGSKNAGEGRSTSGNSRSSETSRKTAVTQRGSSKGSAQGANHEGSFQGESHLEKFFLDQLQDIYYAEQKITQSLPKMEAAATTQELKEAFEDHLHQTQRHVKRLEKVFESLGKKAEGKKCEAIEGISREVETIISETEEGTLTRDAALIIAAQKVEHYEIATYGGLVQLAITMQLHDAADLLDRTLVEEEDTDSRLTEIAENDINLQAEHEGAHYSWDQDEQQGASSSETEEEGEETEDEDEEEEDVDEESPNL
jgi:ferritin-like metal-binding protein YciE